MRVDEKATLAARKRHESGVKELARIFRAGPWADNTADRSGRWLTKLNRHTRAMIRAAKDQQNPKRVVARRRRQIARASRARNRRPST